MEPKLPSAPEVDSEISVGISEYINRHPSIMACYKYRYSDFIVIEIGENNTLSEHNSADPPAWKARIDAGEFKKSYAPLALSDDQKTNLSAVMDKDQIEEIEELYGKLNSKEKLPTLEIDLGWSDSKEERTKIHHVIRQNLPNFESTIAEHCGRKLIKAIYTKVIKRTNFGDEKYLSFTLMKKNQDTGNVCSRLAKLLHKRPQDMEVAGNKDKRGVTSQRVVMGRINPQDLMRIMYIPNWPFEEIQFSNPKFCKKGLKIGDLYGNKFRLA
jgi:tRNA pseudouridine13 synthase